MAVETRDPRTYGNWRQPGGGGLFGLSKTATYAALGWTAVSLVVMIVAGVIPGGLSLILGVAAIAAASVPLLHGRTFLQGVTPRAAHAWDRLGGRTRHRAGPLTTRGTFPLPGLAATTRLREGTDAQGNPFAIVTIPRRQHHTIVFTVDPDGAALVDEDDVDTWVARWGAWLAGLGNEPGILAAGVIVETSPDSGERLKRELDTTTTPDAAPVARGMLQEIRDGYPVGSAIVKAMVTVTFRGTRGQYRQDLVHDLAGRIANIAAGLHGTGAGAARPWSAAELSEEIRCAYDPSAQQVFDDARAIGSPLEIPWDTIGPASADSHYGHYQHDGAASVTWAMTAAPRGNVTADILTRLLRPHPDIDRKRVALLYRPLDSARAARVVEADKRDADATVRNAKNPTARAAAEQRSATQSASEEAQGAGLVNFAVLITATAATPERLDGARRAVEQLAPTARIGIRPVYGAQEAAFTAGLPLGVVLPAHQKTTRVKEGL